MDDNPARPATDAAGTGTLPPVDVAQTEWAGHPVLRKARLNVMGDGLEWPEATFEQLPFLREIALVADDGVLCARLAAQFNLDRFVDAETDENAPAQPPGNTPDRQRFYTRVTDNGFHVVGVFSAATVAGRRRYFQWLTGTWVEIGLNGFLYVRDDLDTHFSEVSPHQLEETQPGSTTTSMTPDEDWTIESLENRFTAEPAAEPASEPAAAPAPVASSSAAVQHAVAVALATVAHRSDTDFAGAALIDHAARVAEAFDPVTDPIRHCAAWLHDVLERSDLTERDLLDAGILPEIVDIVSILTRRDGVDEIAWLATIAASEPARSVKLAAVEDNTAAWRTRRLDDGTRSALAERRAAIRSALGVATQE
jgi:hypothetical protein